MKTKYFALLLVIPVAVFAADRLTASNTVDGGGKEKKTTETKAPAQPQAQEGVSEPAEQSSDVAEQATETTTASTEATETKTTTTKVASSLKKQILADEEALSTKYYDQMNEDQIMWLDEDVLGESEVKWLVKHVSDVLDDENPLKMNLARSFSRCPSGYHISLIKDGDKITHTGWLIAQDGCSDVPMGRFRYDRPSSLVEVFVGETGQVLPIREFCKAYAAAHS